MALTKAAFWQTRRIVVAPGSALTEPGGFFFIIVHTKIAQTRLAACFAGFCVYNLGHEKNKKEKAGQTA